MGCDLPVPDHTTLSRRRRTVDVVVETSTNKRSTDIVLDSTGLKFFGAGEWARAKHGETRRSWRKLHISVDPASSEIRTHELTGDDTADATMAGPLVAGSGGMIRRVFADGAYDGEPVTKAIREARPPNSPPEIIIPPRATSIPPPDTPHGGSEREHHAAEIASKGRMNWQKRQGYGLRALGETAMARVKRLNGGKLNARTLPIPTNRNRHADRRTQSLYPCGGTKHNQDPLTNRGMGDHTIAAPCTKAVDYVFGRARNDVLLKKAQRVRGKAAMAMIETGQPVRAYGDFHHITKSRTWARPRRVIAKVEHKPGHQQRCRFLVTSLDRHQVPSRELYEDTYCPRGDMENRIKDCQLDLFANRMSAHAYKANQLRLLLAAFAYVLIDGIRRVALKKTTLAKAVPNTIRLKLLKLGAKVINSVRCIKLSLPDACPYKDLFFKAHAALAPP